jgi:DNA mismatch repair ATPase MutL
VLYIRIRHANFQSPEEAELTEHIKFIHDFLKPIIEDRRHEINGTTKSRSSRRTSKRQSSKSESTTGESTKRQSSSSKRESSKSQSSKRESSSRPESSKRGSSKRESSKRGSSSRDTNSTRGDLLSMYIEYANATNNPEMASDKSMLDMIQTMLVAGRDTTSCLLTHCFNALDKQPHIQDKLVEEFSQAFESSDDVTFDGIKDCNYADAVFNETLRTTSPVSDLLPCV